MFNSNPIYHNTITFVHFRYFLNWVRKHPPNYHLSKKRFYPVFGKRSIEEHTHPEDKFFLNHHRSTRHDLYLQIEKFLDAWVT